MFSSKNDFFHLWWPHIIACGFVNNDHNENVFTDLETGINYLSFAVLAKVVEPRTKIWSQCKNINGFWRLKSRFFHFFSVGCSFANNDHLEKQFTPMEASNIPLSNGANVFSG